MRPERIQIMSRDIKKVLFDYEVLRRTQAGIAHFSSRDVEKVRKACGEDPDGSGDKLSNHR